MTQLFNIKYDIKPSPDMMELFIIALPGMGTYANQIQIMDALEQMKVKAEIDVKAIQDLMASAEINERTLIAKAKPPKHGVNGYLKLFKEMSDDPVFIPEEDGEKVNYREAIKFQLVEKGEKIAELIEPVQGEAGENLFGTLIPCEVGKKEKFQIGNGVSQQGNQFFATLSGRPKYKDNLLNVLDVLEIDGNISMKTGNVRYPGVVIVHGDVEDTFEVHSDSDITVMGLVGDSKIFAKGNITVAGGVIGNKQAFLSAGGNIEVKFAQNAKLEARGEILITKEARHCELVSNKWIRFNSGGIIGGSSMAQLGIDAQFAGADSNPKTLIKIGFHPDEEKVNDQKKSLFKVVDSIEQKFNHLLEGNEPLEKEGPLLKEAIDLLKKIEARINQLNIELNVLKEAKIAVSPEFIIHREIFTHVKLVAPNCVSEFHENYKGKAKWTPDVESGKFISGGLS